ncbi:hypothetical protein [Spirillospora sp. NPDC047279]|uniref:hypothetical protein n=1 Tax=Spirillospora sp. NPDC047279 TaxID=3155478 RepID=UPI0033CD57B1
MVTVGDGGTPMPTCTELESIDPPQVPPRTAMTVCVLAAAGSPLNEDGERHVDELEKGDAIRRRITVAASPSPIETCGRG